MCQFIVLVFHCNFLLGVFITKKSCLVMFSFNTSSFLNNKFELVGLVLCQITSCTETYL